MKKIVILIFITLFALNIAQSAGIGIAPASISVKNILRGGYAEVSFVVSNPNDINITVSIGVLGEIKEWSKPLKKIVIVPPRSSHTFKVIITPPKDLPIGVHEGEVIVSAKPMVTNLGGGSGAAISAAAASIVKLEINDVEIRKPEMVSVRIKENEECKPFYVYPKIKNLGNVRIYPNYKVYLYAEDGTLVKEKEESFEELLPTQEREDMIKIETRLDQIRCIPEGTYKLKLEFYDEENFVSKEEKNVKIHPPGTFSVLGKIINISVPKIISLGGIVKVEAIFKNIGEAVVNAKLKGEVYYEGELIDLIESDYVTLNPNEETELVSYFKPKETGNYTIYTWISYESKTTDKYKFVVKVLERNLIPYIILVVLIIVGILIALKMRKKRR